MHILPDNVDKTKIEASFKDGMLNIQIPKSEKSTPKAILVCDFSFMNFYRGGNSNG